MKQTKQNMIVLSILKCGKGGLVVLSTMVISTIKHNGDGNPQRAKYRIVALGLAK
jgi:hypothetical protein